MLVLKGFMELNLYVFLLILEVIEVGLSVRVIVFWYMVFLGFGGLMICGILGENFCLMWFIRYGDVVNLLMIIRNFILLGI